MARPPSVFAPRRTYSSSRRINNGSGNWTLAYASDKDVLYWTDTSVGSKNSNWRNLVARGGDASTAYYTDWVEDVRVPDLFFHDKDQLVTGYETVSHMRAMAIDNPFVGVVRRDAALQDLALKRLKSKLANQQNRFDLLVPLAEVRELRGLVRQSADLSTGLVKTLLNVRNRPRDAVRYAQDAWLNWSFGMNPLINDTKDLAVSIATFQNRENGMVRVTGTAQKDWKSRYVGVKDSQLSDNSSLTAYADMTHHLSYKYIGGFNLKLKSANNYGLVEHLGLNFNRLPSVAWELVAYSWLFDYFTTTGEFLDDVFTSPPGDTKYVILNTRYTCDVRVFTDGSPVYTPPYKMVVKIDSRPGFGGFKYGEFQRDVLSSLPHRSLRFKTVDEIGKNAVNRLLNLTSLLREPAISAGPVKRVSRYYTNSQVSRVVG